MAHDGAAPPSAAIVLAGGRASRLDGVDKPLLDVGGRTLLARAVSAAQDAGCAPVVVAGRERPGFSSDLVWAQEDPPFGGPVAGLAAALRILGAELPGTARVLVLPGDLVDPDAAVDTLLAADVSDDEGVCLQDQGGRAQWLTAIHPVAALRDGLAALPRGGRDASLRELLAGMRLSSVPAQTRATHDVDTWEDLDEARRMLVGPDESRRPADG